MRHRTRTGIRPAGDDGGHQHIEYHPDHPYLAAESLPMVVNSPHGGMPSR